MKNFLTILWIIIVLGLFFVLANPFEPATPDQPIAVENPEDSTTEEEGSKTFKQYIAAAAKNQKEGYFDQAIDNYKKALQLNPDSSSTLFKLGNVYLINNQATEAKEIFTKALELNPKSADIQVGLIRSHINSRAIEQAREITWKLDATNPKIKYYKALIHILYKEFDAAENIFKELATTELQGQSKIYLDAFVNASYYRESEEIFVELLMAKAMTDTQEFEAAIPLLFDIINQKNNYRDAWIVLGYAYLNTSRAPDAVDAFKQAQTLSPEKPETLFFLGLAYFANNEIDEAIHYLKKAEEAGYEPKDQIELKLGDLYTIKENFKEAAKQYEKVIALNPQNIDLYIQPVWVYIDKLNEPEKGLKIAEKAIEYHPEKAMSYNLAGWAYTAMGQYTEAKRFLGKALEIDPSLDAVQLNLGWLYEKQNMIAVAKEYYKKAYVLGKGNSIGNRAAVRFNDLQVSITAPNSPSL